jgi:hypothetical protein
MRRSCGWGRRRAAAGAETELQPGLRPGRRGGSCGRAPVVRQPNDAACDGEQAPAVRQVGDGTGCGGEEVAGHGTTTDGQSTAMDGRSGNF